MKKIFIIPVLVLLFGQTTPVFAESTQANILIVEVQTGQISQTGNDFVELYNPNPVPVNVTGWRLQYRSASALPAASWLTKRTFACATGSPAGCTVELAPHGRLVVATYDIPGVTEQLIASGGFASEGGQLRLVLPAAKADAPNFEQDMLGYGTAGVSRGAPALAPEAGKSLKRVVSEDGYFVDTNNNAQDFIIGCANPTPGELAEPLLGVPPDCDQPGDPDPPGDPPIEDPVYLPLELTELLPDPTAPAHDDTDEFVEIYNPNSEPVNIKNYELRTGINLQNKIVLGDNVVAPNGYYIVTSADSQLSLSNAGTVVQLVDPTGRVLEESPHYGTAKPGQSWVKNSSGWHWSTTPTPLALNILTVAQEVVKAASTTTKKPATKAPAKKVAAAKTTQPKEPKAKADAKDEPKPAQQVAKTTPNYWVIGAIAGLAATYGAYEYRKDLRRFGESAIAKLKEKGGTKNH